MPHIGWHASHEQISPGRLLAAAQRAEAAGFAAGMSSDQEQDAFIDAFGRDVLPLFA